MCGAAIDVPLLYLNFPSFSLIGPRKIEEIDSSTNYRLSATAAYYKLVEQRIQDLREERLESFQTSYEFLSRRLQPAIRTTEAFSRRLESLATRAQSADNLVRTQIEMGVQIQLSLIHI